MSGSHFSDWCFNVKLFRLKIERQCFKLRQTCWFQNFPCDEATVF